MEEGLHEDDKATSADGYLMATIMARSLESLLLFHAGQVESAVALGRRLEARLVATRLLDGDEAALDLLEDFARGPERDAIYGPILPALMGPELSATPRARELIRLAYTRD